jgi:hypothetical protein
MIEIIQILTEKFHFYFNYMQDKKFLQKDVTRCEITSKGICKETLVLQEDRPLT